MRFGVLLGDPRTLDLAVLDAGDFTIALLGVVVGWG